MRNNRNGNLNDAMKVGELKKKLEGVPDWAPVVLEEDPGDIRYARYARSIRTIGFERCGEKDYWALDDAEFKELIAEGFIEGKFQSEEEALDKSKRGFLIGG